MHGWNEDEDLVFRGLNDPTRRAILALLSARHDGSATELSVTKIAAQFPEIGRTAISAHLRILRESGLVAESQEGRHRIYRLGPNRAASALDFLRQVYSTSVTTPEPEQSAVSRKNGPGRPRRPRRTA